MSTKKLKANSFAKLLRQIEEHFEETEMWSRFKELTIKKEGNNYYTNVPVNHKLTLNNADDYDMIKVTINEELTPTLFKNKLACLMEGTGLSEKEAREMLEQDNPYELELYYEVGYGLMGVDPNAVEAGTIYSPYTSNLYHEPDED